MLKLEQALLVEGKYDADLLMQKALCELALAGRKA